MVTLHYVNNDDAGFSGEVQIPENTTIAQFLAIRGQGADLDNFSVRLNREEIDDLDKELETGDRLSVTPKKVKGNC